jgi:hypothetical protein
MQNTCKGKNMTGTRKDKSKVEIYMTDDQLSKIKDAATNAGLQVATWCRAQLILASGRRPE